MSEHRIGTADNYALSDEQERARKQYERGLTYERLPEVSAWLEAVDAWRRSGMVGEQPEAPDLARGVIERSNGQVVRLTHDILRGVDLRGLDLRDQTPGLTLHMQHRDRWQLLGCTLPGEEEHRVGHVDILIAILRAVCMDLRLPSRGGYPVAIGDEYDRIMDEVRDIADDAAERIMRVLLTADLTAAINQRKEGGK